MEDDTSDQFKAYSSVASQYRDDYVFAYTTDAAALTDADITAPKIILYKQFDDGKAVYDGKFVKEDIVSFVTTNSVPLVDEIGPDNYSFYVGRGIPIAYLFYSTPDDKKKFGEFLDPLAKEYKGKLSFVYIDAVKFGAHGKTLNLKEEWPAFAIQNPSTNAKWPFDQKTDITAASLSKFVKDFVAGKLEPSLKSEPVPASNDGPVKIVVGTNYESIVLDKSKDVLLEVYARKFLR